MLATKYLMEKKCICATNCLSAQVAVQHSAHSKRHALDNNKSPLKFLPSKTIWQSSHMMKKT